MRRQKHCCDLKSYAYVQLFEGKLFYCFSSIKNDKYVEMLVLYFFKEFSI